jgi:hypothetical protein
MSALLPVQIMLLPKEPAMRTERPIVELSILRTTLPQYPRHHHRLPPQPQPLAPVPLPPQSPQAQAPLPPQQWPL